MKIAFLGIGATGAALARALIGADYDVILAARDPGSDTVRRTVAQLPGLTVSPMADGLAASEIVILAAPFMAHRMMLSAAGAGLDGKILIDSTNPIGPDGELVPMEHPSGGEAVQALVPRARVVKAFSVYAAPALERPWITEPAAAGPLMPIAGDDAVAKNQAASLCRDLGWLPVDAGGLVHSGHLERLALLLLKMIEARSIPADFTLGSIPEIDGITDKT